MAEFEPAFEFMIAHEGEYVNDPNDAGGETKYGISKAAHPDVDIASLTIDEVKGIYLRKYWDTQRYWEIQNQRVATKIFDMAVNMGFHQAHRIAQAACEMDKCDGIMGPQTIAEINAADNPQGLLETICAGCILFYDSLVAKKPSNAKFLKGWLARAKHLPPASMSPNTGLMEEAGK